MTTTDLPGTTTDAAGAVDRDRPLLHVRPPRGWLNDPNGVARVDGTYHVFFQHNPDRHEHDAITWGHASSPDLLRWTDEPVALRPRPGEADAAGCWTGCLVDDDGVPTAVYSGVADRSGASSVVLARSDRTLRRWTPEPLVAVGMPAEDELEHPVTDVRDPFLFVHDGRRYAIQGAGRRGGVAQVLLYDAADLTAWRLLGPLLTAEDPVAAAHAPADIWECPNLVRVDGRWVLVLSLWALPEASSTVDGEGLLTGVTALVGDLVHDGDGLRFAAVAGSAIDAGPTFYAPQLLVEEDRTLLWGWAWEHGRTPEQLQEAGWAGVLTSPRELRVVGDRVDTVLAAELVGLRRGRIDASAPVREPAFEILGRGAARLLLVGAGEEDVVLDIPDGDWRLLVDGSLVELFPEDPATRPVTTRAYPGGSGAWVVDGDVDAQAWALGLPED
ncbi:glycoside hydrolase family 32 protein [uncultured Pseudokineococcus sp.]|uniref:glycoside hydrolase family 32 protein n=1 Tax=uncultured Pseudokineococcus sp. TaxID=1642928 RepID=UPI002603C398|nr:glycoside hydrolase family 32 protein [uncultured Pseudokineococcus sp.]